MAIDHPDHQVPPPGRGTQGLQNIVERHFADDDAVARSNADRNGKSAGHWRQVLVAPDRFLTFLDPAKNWVPGQVAADQLLAAARAEGDVHGSTQDRPTVINLVNRSERAVFADRTLKDGLHVAACGCRDDGSDQFQLRLQSAENHLAALRQIGRFEAQVGACFIADLGNANENEDGADDHEGDRRYDRQQPDQRGTQAPLQPDQRGTQAPLTSTHGSRRNRPSPMTMK